MSLDSCKDILKYLVTPNTPFLCVSCAMTGLLSFSPTLREKLDIELFYQRFHDFFSLVLIYSSCFICYNCSKWSLTKFKEWRNYQKQKRCIIQRLAELKSHERELLSFFLSQNSDVVWLPVEDASVVSLIDKMLFYRAHNISALKSNMNNRYILDQCWACSITPATREIIARDFPDIPQLKPSQENLRLWAYSQGVV